MGTATAHKAPAKKVSINSPAGWIIELLHKIKAPVNHTTVGNLGTWLANEQTSAANWQQNKGNPLGVQSPAALAAGRSGNVAAGLDATAQLLLSSYPTIVATLRHSAPASMFNSAVSSSSWNGAGHYGGTTTFANKGTAQKANPTGWWGQWVEPLWGSATPPGGWNTAVSTSGIPGSKGFVTASQVPVTAVKDTVGAVTSTAGFLGKLTNPTNLHNVGVFAGGAALAILGLVIVFAGSKGKQVVELGSKVAA